MESFVNEGDGFFCVFCDNVTVGFCFWVYIGYVVIISKITEMKIIVCSNDLLCSFFNYFLEVLYVLFKTSTTFFISD